MAFPAEPSPYPQLREGLALGAREHRGFVAAWNWISGLLRKAADFFCLGVNNRTGSVSIVAGDGIAVIASGNTITISTGNGENIDEDAATISGGGTGDGTGSSGSGSSRTDGTDGTGGGSWTGQTPASKPADPSTDCNDWSEEPKNDNSSETVGNTGDSCSELNGW